MAQGGLSKPSKVEMKSCVFGAKVIVIFPPVFFFQNESALDTESQKAWVSILSKKHQYRCIWSAARDPYFPF